jgi:hypothetical protein
MQLTLMNTMLTTLRKCENSIQENHAKAFASCQCMHKTQWHNYNHSTLLEINIEMYFLLYGVEHSKVDQKVCLLNAKLGVCQTRP